MFMDNDKEMWRMRPDRTGFTLIELLIVIIIIGVLASIAAPMIGSLKAKAICTEAVTMMAVVRDAVRQYFIMNGCYPVIGSMVTGAGLNATPNYREKLGLNIDDFNGAYIGKECLGVYINSSNLTSLSWPGLAYITCVFKGIPVTTPPINSAPRASEAIALGDGSSYGPILYMYISNGNIKQ
jgi:prepilin-type N-terminal cleavage/methylation domain-containing protein